MKVEEVCRQHGISSATYYKWKSKYGGMEVVGVTAAQIRKKLRQTRKRRLQNLAEGNHEYHCITVGDAY